MAEKYWDYLKLKNGDRAHFIPPAPNGDKLGGISEEELENFRTLSGDYVDHEERIKAIEQGEMEWGYRDITPVTWTADKYINPYTRAEDTLENANISSFIEVNPGDKVLINAKSYYDVQPVCLYYDNERLKTLFPGTVGASTAYKNYEFTVPDDVHYIRLVSYSLGGYTKADTWVKQLMLVPADDKKWKGIKWCAIGDSLTEANSKASMKYHDIINRETGIEVQNYGVGGTGYYKMQDINLAFYQRITAVPTDADVYTIFGSFNDIGCTIGQWGDHTSDTLYGCVDLTLKALFNRNPDAIVGIITPTPWEWCNSYRLPATGDEYVAAIIDIANRWSIPVLDLYHCSGLKPWDDYCKEHQFGDADGVHPNNFGNEIIAPKIKQFLEQLIRL